MDFGFDLSIGVGRRRRGPPTRAEDIVKRLVSVYTDRVDPGQGPDPFP